MLESSRYLLRLAEKTHRDVVEVASSR
jgi:hypothetical protein